MMSCTDRYLSAPFGSFANNYPHFDVINWPVGTSCGCVTKKLRLLTSPRDNTKQTTKYYYFFSDPVGIRTRDPQLRRLLLYPAELPDQTISGCKGTKKSEK